jgi:hypothetical protein
MCAVHGHLCMLAFVRVNACIHCSVVTYAYLLHARISLDACVTTIHTRILLHTRICYMLVLLRTRILLYAYVCLSHRRSLHTRSGTRLDKSILLLSCCVALLTCVELQCCTTCWIGPCIRPRHLSCRERQRRTSATYRRGPSSSSSTLRHVRVLLGSSTRSNGSCRCSACSVGRCLLRAHAQTCSLLYLLSTCVLSWLTTLNTHTHWKCVEDGG